MNNLFTRRKFLQTAAVSTSAAMLPSIAGAETGTISDRHAAPVELPKRRLGRTNVMVSCIGFGSGSRYCNWVAEDEGAHQKYIDYAIKLSITYFDCARAYGNDIGLIAIKILGQNSLIGNVTGDDLVRWTLRLPISVANIGMDGYSPIESCVSIGKEPLISEAVAKEIELKLAFDPKVTKLPYYTGKN